MSKQSEAKISQGYVAKAVPKTCCNCKQFISALKLPEWCNVENEKRVLAGMKEPYSLDKNGIESYLYCGLGLFAVKKMATCDKFYAKVTP